ncbi:unnamed protein product, partial [Rotaria sp. Silwood2]
MENQTNVLLENDKQINLNDSYDYSNEYSLSKSPSRLSDNETCRTIVSMLINQRKTNLDLEQQLKHLQSSIKPISLYEHQTHSFGYSSGSSIDGSSTILSAFSSRSNSSLSERSKTSPTSFKSLLTIKSQITTDEDFSYKSSILYQQQQQQTDSDEPSTKRRKFINIEENQGPRTRSRSISERGVINESCSILRRKRKSSIVCEQNQSEIKQQPTIDYIKQLDEMKNQYIKSSTNRHSTNESINKSQLASKLK